MREDQPCKVVCRKKLDAESAKNFKEKIDDEYRVNRILDNLPVAVLRQRRDGSQSTTCEHGCQVGFKGNYAGTKEEKYFINNHLSFRVMFHRDAETDATRIVGFEVTPKSINHEYKEWDEKNPQIATCNKDTKYLTQASTIFSMTLVTMIFALLGFLSPSNRGGLMTAMVLLWVFMGIFAGYSSGRLYKMFKGTEWKRNTLETAIMFPSILFVVFFVLNGLIWGEQSSGAVPFGTMLALVFLCFGISVPLVFVGSYFGFKRPAIEDPVKTNKIPKVIPDQPWYMKSIFSMLIGGILPFGAVFIELFFILTSIWLNQFYYIFGFLFTVFIILIITCAEITIVLCYFQLCSEDYRWWWRSYLTVGSSALYLFLYSIFYFFTKLEITKLVSGILYFGYMVIISYAFFVLTGTVGFYACFWFVRKIYSSVKID
ncbi:Transmembrane 9 superfamily member 9 [Hibiscus syriacus]|uniref:Transmembrane 9 superfamily member n=1 Tax=Hibiscus syriacus TaxID=106335 RepID=A0A6A3BYQ1_HIBSY|nr:Transmembrane 9 superfamily member 9 [Hibiscus syriacus]